MLTYFYNCIFHLSAANFDRNWWRIENPVRIRDGTAAVCVEAPHATKVSHWEWSREGSAESLWCASQKNCLNVLIAYLFSTYRKVGIFCIKSVAEVFYDFRSFYFTRAVTFYAVFSICHNPVVISFVCNKWIASFGLSLTFLKDLLSDCFMHANFFCKFYNLFAWFL